LSGTPQWLQTLNCDTKRVVADRSLAIASRLNARHYVGLDYPPNRTNLPRYTEPAPHARLHAALAAETNRYRDSIRELADYSASLRELPLHATDARQPSLVNDFLPGLDSAAIYGFIRQRRPRTYVEIGSGNSTKFAARAKVDAQLNTSIISIDPHPRSEIDELCDVVVRSPLEDCVSEVTSRIRAGDMLFYDGSHCVYMGNDVAVFFMEVLPELPAGVLVGIHDIHLPFDYPEPFAGRFYTEQYMLAAWLLARPDVDVILPGRFVRSVPELAAEAAALWDGPGLGAVQRHGDAFWMLTR
jgi:hypothetical protein